jgi:hypothetical protein
MAQAQLKKGRLLEAYCYCCLMEVYWEPEEEVEVGVEVQALHKHYLIEHKYFFGPLLD